MITIGAVLLIVLIYAIVIARQFFKDTGLSKEVKEKMLADATRQGFEVNKLIWVDQPH